MEDNVHKRLCATWFLFSTSYISISASKEESNLQFNASAVWIRQVSIGMTSIKKISDLTTEKTEDNVALWKVFAMTV